MLCPLRGYAQVATLICDGRADAGEDAYVGTGQDTGTLRVTIREAANRLGITEAAVRKRIQRGSLGKEVGSDGRVYVYLDLSQDMSHPESQIHRNSLVEELKDRVRFLEDQMQQANERDRENRRIIAALTSRIPELEAPREQEAPQEPPGGPQSAGAGSNREEAPPAGDGTQEGAEPRSSWWRRVFGG
jgi:hypothetical protein